MSVVERLLKRQKFEVTVGENTFYVREMPVDELRSLDEKVPDLFLRSYYIIGRSLVGDNGEFDKTNTETDQQYAERMQSLLSGIGTGTLAQLTSAITKFGTIPRQDKLQKN